MFKKSDWESPSIKEGGKVLYISKEDLKAKEKLKIKEKTR